MYSPPTPPLPPPPPGLPVCVSFPSSAISAICNHGHSRLPLSSRSLFSPRLFFISFRQEHLLQKENPNCVPSHPAARTSWITKKQANRLLVTKKNSPWGCGILFETTRSSRIYFKYNQVGRATWLIVTHLICKRAGGVEKNTSWLEVI